MQEAERKGTILYGSLCFGLDNMRVFLQEYVPITWKLFRHITERDKDKRDFVTVSSLLSMLHNGNQEINTYEVS